MCREPKKVVECIILRLSSAIRRALTFANSSNALKEEVSDGLQVNIEEGGKGNKIED